MDLHYVIGEQLVAKRRGSTQSKAGDLLVIAPRNGRIERAPRLARRQARPKAPRGGGLKTALSAAASASSAIATGFKLALGRLSSALKPVGARNARFAARARFKPAPDPEFAPSGIPVSPARPAAAPRRIAKPLPKNLIIATAALCAAGTALAAAAFALSALPGSIDEANFSLPDDGAIGSLLLDSVAMEKIEADEVGAAFEMPLSLTMSQHAVRRDETLDSIAKRFGVRLDTLISVNGIRDVRRIPSGTKLKVPNIDGVVHLVRKGESLSGIAASAGIPVLDVIDANDLTSQTIHPGQTLFIPGARLAASELKKALGNLVAWPAPGRISSRFGYRPNPFTGVRQFHSGIDIVAPENSHAKAAMDGRVAETGYSALFGNFVILSHSDGYQTLYAHLNKIGVIKGKRVDQGSSVGLVGSTGYSTGVHLHFGMYRYGKAIDPIKLLGSR